MRYKNYLRNRPFPWAYRIWSAYKGWISFFTFLVILLTAKIMLGSPYKYS